jgi:chromosome segregation ATPase
MAIADILARLPQDQVDDTKVVRMPSRQRSRGGEPGGQGELQPKLSAAFELLDRAAATVEALQGRCEKLESLLLEAVQRAETEIAAADAKSGEWERRTRRIETDLYETEQLLREAESRAKKAEGRADAAENRARAAEESTLEACKWLNAYCERVTKSMGAQPAERAG